MLFVPKNNLFIIPSKNVFTCVFKKIKTSTTNKKEKDESTIFD